MSREIRAYTVTDSFFDDEQALFVIEFWGTGPDNHEPDTMRQMALAFQDGEQADDMLDKINTAEGMYCSIQMGEEDDKERLH